MGGLDGAVSEVFLHPEHVYPALRQWHADTHILTGDLAHLSADVTRNQDVGRNIHLPGATETKLMEPCIKICSLLSESKAQASEQKRINLPLGRNYTAHAQLNQGHLI